MQCFPVHRIFWALLVYSPRARKKFGFLAIFPDVVKDPLLCSPAVALLPAKGPWTWTWRWQVGPAAQWIVGSSRAESEQVGWVVRGHQRPSRRSQCDPGHCFSFSTPAANPPFPCSVLTHLSLNHIVLFWGQHYISFHIIIWATDEI